MTLYFDYNATSPLRPPSLAAIHAVLQAGPGNASSVHALGQMARKTIEHARGQVAAALGVTSKQVIFNSGATEGNNTVLHAYRGGRIFISATEHASVYDTRREMGAALIPVDRHGVVDAAALERMCADGPPPTLISVMWVNNETGVINPVADVARIARQYGAAFHVDAVQAFGKMPMTFGESGADFMTVSSHKIGGPQGVGAIIIGDGNTGACLPPPVLLTGGGQERRLRAGTENVAGIAGFGAAANALSKGPFFDPTLTARVEKILMDTRPDTVIFGAGAARIGNTTCFAVPKTEAQILLMKLDLAGVAVSSGSACSSGKVGVSHVLTAMGVDPLLARGALRISLGFGTTGSEIDQFGEIWKNMAI